MTLLVRNEPPSARSACRQAVSPLELKAVAALLLAPADAWPASSRNRTKRLLLLLLFRLGVPLAEVSITKNAAGESQIKMLESVREFDVYILNTGCGEINTSCVPAAPGPSLLCAGLVLATALG